MQIRSSDIDVQFRKFEAKPRTPARVAETTVPVILIYMPRLFFAIAAREAAQCDADDHYSEDSSYRAYGSSDGVGRVTWEMGCAKDAVSNQPADIDNQNLGDKIRLINAYIHIAPFAAANA